MDWNEYQAKAAETAIYGDEFKIIYPAMGLGSETGEVLGKISKVLRDNNGKFTEDKRLEIADELGDVLWEIAMIAKDLDIPLSYVANRNLEKLKQRKEKGTIGGSGDTR